MHRELKVDIQGCVQCPYFRDSRGDSPSVLGKTGVLLMCWHPYGKFETEEFEEITKWFNECCPLPELDKSIINE